MPADLRGGDFADGFHRDIRRFILLAYWCILGAAERRGTDAAVCNNRHTAARVFLGQLLDCPWRADSADHGQNVLFVPLMREAYLMDKMLTKNQTSSKRIEKNVKKPRRCGHNTERGIQKTDDRKQNTGPRRQDDGPAVSELKSMFPAYSLVNVLLEWAI